MGFKDMVADDRLSVMLDADFFGETYRIEGKEIPIVLDNDELKARQGGQDLAVAESATLFMPVLRTCRRVDRQGRASMSMVVNA